MPVVAFIPARGGSKSIPLKNIRLFCGKPLIYWNLKAINDVNKIDKVVVATDSDQIEETVNSFKLSKVEVYRRLPKNATDTSSTESVMLEYLEQSGLENEDTFLLVQATSPLTTTEDFTKALEQYDLGNIDSLLSGVNIKRFFWNKDGSPKNYDFRSRPRRQDFDGEFMENGAFYINRVQNIIKDKNRLSGKIGLFEMPEYTAIEIDEPDDWKMAEHLMRKYILPQSNTTSQVKLFLTDVDGVLTDAGMYYSESGDELKKFNTKDGMGLELLRNKGVKTGIITSEITDIVKRRAEKLKVDYLSQGKKGRGKLESAIAICKKQGISLQEVAYIGDDLNCIDLLSSVGLAACPIDAAAEVKNIDNIIVLTKKGGEGVVREFVEIILSN